MRFRLLIVLTLFALSASSCTTRTGYHGSNSFKETLDENGCYLVEDYNSDNDTCDLNCDKLNEQQCDELAFQVYSELDDFIDENFEGYDNDSEDGSDAQPIASYSIDNRLSLTERVNTTPENEATFKRIWNAVLAILPENVLRNEVAEYRVNTDGKDNTLAFVTLHETIPKKWIISIDPADFKNENDKEFIHTVIHEFAHIVFLNKSQVDLNSTDNCANYSFTEGCSNSDSFINAYYQRFWDDIVDDNPTALSDEEPTEENEAQVLEFYDQYSTHFVSEYAATNPIEDVAEIFVHFVLGKKPQLPGTVVEQKIGFLHQFPELTQLRTAIRVKLRKLSDK